MAPLDQFIRQTYGPLLAHVLRRVRQRQSAEDIVQTAYARLFADRAFDPARPAAGGYLRQQAEWLIGDHFRKRKVLPPLVAEPPDDQPPELAAQSAETRDVVGHAVAGLDPRHQSVILSWLGGNSHEETAEQLQLPIRRVYALFHEAKARLRGPLAARAL